MSANPAEQLPENKLVNDVKELQRWMEEIKTAQRIGADNMVIDTLSGSWTIGTVAAGANGGFIATVTPEFGGLLLLDYTIELRVDVNDAAHQWPNGSSLTPAQRGAPLIWIVPDSGFSGLPGFTNPADGTRAFTVTVENFDSNPHDYFVHYTYYGLVTPYA